MPLFPLFADLTDREVLVVGGGDVAERKIEALLHAGARVQVHAHRLNDAVAQWLAQGRLSRREAEFDPAWLDVVWLVVAATDDRAFNAQLAAHAGQRRRLINVVDDAELSSFQIPARVDRAPLQVAISSGGAAPMLARHLREQLESQWDHSLGEFAQLFAQHRASIRERLPDLPQRRRWFEQVIAGPVPLLLRNGQPQAAALAFQDALQASHDIPVQGSVMLVGSGNGDPGLLTLKALRALNQADLLICDPAVSPDVLSLARRDAARMPMPADPETCLMLLIDHARNGQCVVALKPGDAYRSGADDAWASRLADAGVACEIVAGVNA